MILSRYLLREIAAHLGAVFAIVLAVFLTRRLGIYLGEALEGEIAASVVFEALGLRTVMSLPSLLPPVLYLAILLGLGRLHEDLELTALAACGVSPDRIARIVVGGAAVAAIAIGVLSLEVRPRAAERVKRVEERATAEARIGSLRPGRFYELGGERVVFAEDSGPGAIEDVFVHTREADETRIYRAKQALDVRTPAGERVLRLIDGTEYVLRRAGKHDVTTFGQLSVRTELPVDDELTTDEKMRPWTTLRASDDPRAAAELQWRLAMPASAFVLAILALPLARVGTRRGRYGRILLAMAVYLVYRQALGTAKDWVESGAIPPFPGLWAVHALAFAVALVLFALLRRGWIGREVSRAA